VKNAVFWVVGLSSLVEIYPRIRCACCLHRQGDETVSTAEMLLNLNQTTRSSNTEESHVQ
jgi:hypothetical protein